MTALLLSAKYYQRFNVKRDDWWIIIKSNKGGLVHWYEKHPIPASGSIFITMTQNIKNIKPAMASHSLNRKLDHWLFLSCYKHKALSLSLSLVSGRSFELPLFEPNRHLKETCKGITILIMAKEAWGKCKQFAPFPKHSTYVESIQNAPKCLRSG